MLQSVTKCCGVFLVSQSASECLIMLQRVAMNCKACHKVFQTVAVCSKVFPNVRVARPNVRTTTQP